MSSLHFFGGGLDWKRHAKVFKARLAPTTRDFLDWESLQFTTSFLWRQSTKICVSLLSKSDDCPRPPAGKAELLREVHLLLTLTVWPSATMIFNSDKCRVQRSLSPVCSGPIQALVLCASGLLRPKSFMPQSSLGFTS